MEEGFNFFVSPRIPAFSPLFVSELRKAHQRFTLDTKNDRTDRPHAKIMAGSLSWPLKDVSLGSFSTLIMLDTD